MDDFYTMEELAGFLGFPVASKLIVQFGIEVVEIGPARCVRLDDVPRLCRMLAYRCLSMSEIAPRGTVATKT